MIRQRLKIICLAGMMGASLGLSGCNEGEDFHQETDPALSGGEEDLTEEEKRLKELMKDLPQEGVVPPPLED